MWWTCDAHCRVAAVDQNLPDTTGSDGLNMALASQLRLCLVALETKQSDCAICKCHDALKPVPEISVHSPGRWSRNLGGHLGHD